MPRLTLVLPGLRLAEPEPPVPPCAFPKLGALLAKADVRRETQPLEARVFACFGFASGGFPPAAAATARIDLGRANDALVRLDPVHVRADPTRLLLFDAAHFDLDAAEADGLVALLARELPALGLVRGADPKRWYARAEAIAGCYGLSPREMAGRALARDLPATGDQRAMQRLLTEVQMVLHETPINQAREQRGQPPINGLWPWGGGALAAAPGVPSSAFGDDVLIAGLAQAAGITWSPVLEPDAAIAAVKRGDAIVISGAPFGAARGVPVHADLENVWCARLASALKRGAIDGLVIAGEAETFTLTRRALLRFWKKAPCFVGPISAA
ncbi:MAG: hypothetical protein HY749_02600 [Gammaproteobacteria bacterium]|nr:hypothetical protein [Gammaproteobacteria bacterium]MBI5617932.1 hypothetical protein [Gammaproteobacteria bacterium]